MNLLEQLKNSLAERTEHGSFFDNLSREQQDELIAIRQAINNGEIKGSITNICKIIVESYKLDISHKTVYDWLRSKRNEPTEST